jgi:putative membrane protein
MNWKQWVTAGCLLTSVFLVSSCDKDDDNDNELNNTDRTFMLQAGVSNTVEVGAAGLALTKSTHPQVRAFASHMVMEHGMAQTELKTLGTNLGVAVKDSVDPAHQVIMTQLMALSGRAFDSAYMHTQVADHTLTLSFFDNEQDNGQHRDVKGYADKYRPHIEMHLTRADSIARAFFVRR